MKRAITALGAGLLTVGIAVSAGLVGSAGAGASLKAHDVETLTVTSSKTVLNATEPTVLHIKVAGAVKGDTYEAGVCNDDGNLTSPLSDSGAAACDGANLSKPASAKGLAAITIDFAPGQQGSAANSTCPASATQTSVGVNCIIAVANVTELLEGDSVATAYTPVFFVQPLGTATATPIYVSGGGNPAKGGTTTEDFITLDSSGGFATDGLYETTSGPATGCQPDSSLNSETWGIGQPACIPGLATGEGVEAFMQGPKDPTTGKATWLPAGVGQAGASFGDPTPGGLDTYTLPSIFGPLAGLTFGSGPIAVVNPVTGSDCFTPGHYSFKLVGVGDPSAGVAGSNVVEKVGITVKAATSATTSGLSCSSIPI